MFLSSLSEKQKQLFIKLAIKAAEANGVVELEEKNMLKAFAIEMNIMPVYSSDDLVEDILKELTCISEEKILRIVTFEILGIMISDAEFDEKEEAFVNEMIRAFGISKMQEEEMLILLKEYLKLFNKISALVVG